MTFTPPHPPLPSPSSSWPARLAWLVLAVGVVSSATVWLMASAQTRAAEDARFQAEAKALQQQLLAQVQHHVDLLTSFQALFFVNGQVEPSVFHRHYVVQRAEERFPAMWGVLYAPYDKQGDVETVRLLFAEPPTRHQSVMGWDLLQDPIRRQAVLRARDSGQVQSSPPLPLKGLDDHVDGLLIRLPVYLPGSEPHSVVERRQQFLGVVVGVLRLDALFTQVGIQQDWRHRHWLVTDLGPDTAYADESPQLAPKPVFDSRALSDEAWVGPAETRAVASADKISQTITTAGRRWQVTLARPSLIAPLQPYPLALLLGGLAGATGLWWALRHRAERERLANERARHLAQQAIDSERRLRAILDHTAEAILSVSPSGRIVNANHAACRLFGHALVDTVGAKLSRIIPDAAPHEATQSVEQYLQHAGSALPGGLGQRITGQHASGRRFPAALSLSTMRMDNEVHAILLIRDLSAVELAEATIREAQRQLNEVDDMRRVIVHHAPYAICVLSPQGIIQTINPAGEKLLGRSTHDLVGRCTLEQFFDPEQVAERAHLLNLRAGQTLHEVNVLKHLVRHNGGQPSEWRLRHADGHVLMAELSVTALTNEQDALTGYLAMAQDVTARHEAERQVQHLAMHDALTDLPNRHMLQEHLKSCLALAEREQSHVAMMFIDLDRFKKINDSLGHHVGDHVLVESARRLRTAMRTSDIVARIGGDEFVVLLPRITETSDGLKVAEKVLETFIEPLRVGPHELRVTPSIGLALYPEHGRDAISLMRHADLAMYQAKHAGRNRVQVFRDDMDAASAESLILENDLYKALERHELRLHYQPQFDCNTGHITGAEALLRWERNGKLVAPGDFIPLAEDTGLIVPMGQWVLEQACIQAQQWRVETGWPLRMAVNLSAVQLEHPQLPATVRQALTQSGLPATALELEITESVVVRESLRAADVLQHLRSLGVSVAIDDFGVGYSSFAYLRELPVNRFKLDRSFLSAVPASPGDCRLVGALIAMAHRLDVSIVAEGVETAEQASFLRNHQCDEAQGYFLGRPMPAAGFRALLQAHADRIQHDVLPARARQKAT